MIQRGHTPGLPIKQVIVVRADLKLRRGKECAQVAHAASMWLRDYALEAHDSSDRGHPPASLLSVQHAWLVGNYRKIVVKATSDSQLRDLYAAAVARGLEAHLVTDDGLTEVPPGTITALAIGPHSEDAFVGLTDDLPLY
jgi:PTH2 family peptidyl-tRNA hydrolase